MKVTVTLEINNCYDCPFTEQVCMQGYSATDCLKLGPYSTIPNKGIREDCPLKKLALNNDNERNN